MNAASSGSERRGARGPMAGRLYVRPPAARLSIARLVMGLLIAGMGLVAFAGDARALLICDGSGGGGLNGSTCLTATTTVTQTITTQSLTQRVDTYVTEILGKLNGGTVFDQTFKVAYSDPTVQAGVMSARASITTAGGPGVIFTGPTQISQTVTLLSSATVTTSVVQSQMTQTSVSTYVGPQTVPWNGANVALNGSTGGSAGYLGVCTGAGPLGSNCTGGTATPGTVIAGQTDVNINTNTAQQILQTTTTTDNYLTTSLYVLNGTVQPLGTIHADVVAGAFDQADRFSGRLLRAGTDDGGTPSIPPGTAPLAFAEPVLADVVGKFVVPPAPLSRWHVWGESYGYWVREGASAGFPGDTREALGVNAGIGYDLTNNFRLGAAFDVGRTRIDADAVGERALVDLLQVGVYGAWRSGSFYAAANGTLGWGSASTTVAPVGFGFTDSASHSLSLGSVSSETGYHFALFGFTLTPSLGAAWFHVNNGGFTETGGLLALTGPSQAYDRYKGWFGLDGATSFALANGTELSFDVYGKAVGIGGARRIAVPVTFVGAATPLSISGANTGGLGADLGTALNWKFTPNASLYASYAAELRQSYVAQTGAAGIKIAF